MCSTTTSARWTTSGGKVMSDEATNAQVGAFGMEGQGAEAPCR